MIGLPKTYRFTALNSLGQTIAIAGILVTAIRKKFDSNGALSFESSEATVLTNAGTLATATYLEGSWIDNSTDKYLGGEFLLTVVAPASASGDVILYFDISTDGTDEPDNGKGRRVARLNFTTSGTKVAQFIL